MYKDFFMRRTQIYLDETQNKLLHKLARSRDKSASDLIREAVWTLIARYMPAKKGGFDKIIGLYRDESDVEGSTHHDDLYE